jgi:peptidoglycan DL-endopeptidase CwlO
MKNLRNSVLTVTMAIGLAITGLTPAHASTTSTAAPKEASTVTRAVSISTPVPVLKYERPTVTTAPAKPVDAPVEIVQPPSSESVSTVATTPEALPVVASTPAPAPAPAPVVAESVPAPEPVPTPVHSFSGNAVAAAALAQLGVHQDCTALVSNALAAVGIHFHGWPADYMSLGHVVPESAAQPGDLIFYANGGMGLAHIAVYIGGGMAVHGGWDGETTAIASAHIGSGPVFIHIG